MEKQYSLETCLANDLHFQLLAGKVKPLDMRKSNCVPVKQNWYMPISIECDMKGVCGYSTNTDAKAAHIKKGKAKRRVMLPSRRSKPVWTQTFIPIYRIGE